jgi:hypothetical protein
MYLNCKHKNLLVRHQSREYSGISMALKPQPIGTELRHRPIRTVLRIAVLAGALICLYNYQSILDDYALATYRAPTDVATLAAPLGLTRSGQAIFDRAQPQIDGKADFNRDCQTQQGELELGCYVHGRIYILKIDNPVLRPEMETVLAHEILHAGWVRMSQSDQKRTGVDLEIIYHGISDKDLADRMASYAVTEPGEEMNELHSILGTERAVLTPSLEAHYAHYFTDRATIVAAHAQFRAIFTNQGDALASQLATIKGLKGQLAIINAQMERYRISGQINQFNTLVPRQNQLVDQINSMIRLYDVAVDEYNALSRGLDSHSITATEPGV